MRAPAYNETLSFLPCSFLTYNETPSRTSVCTWRRPSSWPSRAAGGASASPAPVWRGRTAIAAAVPSCSCLAFFGGAPLARGAWHTLPLPCSICFLRGMQVRRYMEHCFHCFFKPLRASFLVFLIEVVVSRGVKRGVGGSGGCD